MKAEPGMTLVETLVVLALLAIAATVGMAGLERLRGTVDLRRLAWQVEADAMQCRIASLTSNRKVGLIFAVEDDRWFYRMVEDRDSDGVSRRDWQRGIDVAIGPPRWVAFLSGGAALGVPAGWDVPDPSGSGILPPDDGLRLGDAAIISFSPQASASPCSVYFHDGRERMLALRIAGRDGRIRLLEWQRGWRRWHDLPASAR